MFLDIRCLTFMVASIKHLLLPMDTGYVQKARNTGACNLDNSVTACLLNVASGGCFAEFGCASSARYALASRAG